MKSGKLWFLAAVASVLVLTRAWSQDGYVSSSNARGVIPFGSYQVGGIDNVNLANGAVNLRIPLTERKGRGPDTNLTYVYSSKIWVVSPLGDPTSPDWVPGTLWQPTSELLYGQNVTLGLGSLTWTSQTYTCTMPNQNQYWVVVDSNFVYIEADGAHIQFPNRRMTAQPGYVSPAGCVVPTDPCKFCVPPYGPWVSIGYSDTGTMELDTSGDPFVIRFKDGTQAFWPTNSIDATRAYKDRNGNIIDGTGDTLKRTVFADSNGNPLGYSTATSSITVNTQFPTTGSASYPNCMHQYSSNQFQATTSLSLPNGRSYTFEYDPNFGELTRVNLPTGGYIKFVYHTFPQIDSGLPVGVCTGLPLDSRRVVERRVSEDGVNEQVWHYNYVVDLTGKQPTYTDVTDPLGNVTRHIFANQGGGLSEVQTETRDAAGNLLRKVVNDWAWDRLSGPTQMDQDGSASGGGAKNLRIVGTTTTLVDSNQVSRTETDYESFSYPDASNLNHPATESTMNVTETREFDYGVGVVGPPLRRTHYTYLHDSDANYQSRHIWDRVTSRVVYDGQGNIASQTQYGYDGTPIAGTSNVVQHDYVNYASTMPYRGNLTTTQVWRNTDNSWLTTTNLYDDLGNVIQTQDPGGHNTWFAYDDSWSGTACLPPGTTRAFVTQV